MKLTALAAAATFPGQDVAPAFNIQPSVSALVALAVITLMIAGMGYLRKVKVMAGGRHGVSLVGRFDLWRSPALGMSAGFALSAVGLSMTNWGGLLLPATGLFAAIVGLLVAIQSLRIAAEWPAGASVSSSSALVASGGASTAPSSIAREPSVLLGQIAGAILPHGRSWDELGEQEQQLISEFNGYEHRSIADILLLLIDLIDIDSEVAAPILVRDLAKTTVASNLYFWVLRAVVNARNGAPRQSRIDLRKAYTCAVAPPEWLADLATGLDDKEYGSWYSDDVRRMLVKDILDEQALAPRYQLP